MIVLFGFLILLLLELTGEKREDLFVLPEEEPLTVQSTVDGPSDEIVESVENTQNDFSDNTKIEVPEEDQITIEKLTDRDIVSEPDVEREKPTDTEMEQSYIVEEGDNLWKIAEKQEVLNDPWKWKTILIQNRDKINYTIVSEETGRWKVVVDPGKRLIIKPQEREKAGISFNKSRKKKYALQLMSLNLDQLELAIDIVKFLIKDGYYAYLYRTREKIRNQSTGTLQYFYRIRVGFFETETEARNIGAEILDRYMEKRIFSDDYWAVLPSYQELSGELIDFGIQRTKPWIIQMSHRSNRADAIDDLKALTSLVEFSYISQKKNQEGGYQYRVRVGFYETGKEAEVALAKIQTSSQSRFPNSKILEIHHVMESAPGQSTGETTISKVKNKTE